jgi:hypothetical protein
MKTMAVASTFMGKGCKMLNKDSVCAPKIHFDVMQRIFRKINEHDGCRIIMVALEADYMVINTVAQLNKIGGSCNRGKGGMVFTEM